MTCTPRPRGRERVNGVTEVTHVHVVPGGAEPLEQEDAAGSNLDRHQRHHRPRGGVERLEEGRGRDDACLLGDQDCDPGFQEGDREVYDLLAAGVDLERGHDNVGLMVNQLGHEAVPLPVDNSAPLSITHPEII